MRLRPSAPSLSRVIAKDTVYEWKLPDGRIARQWVPKGTEAGYSPMATHLSPENWDKPTEFLPERWLEIGKSIDTYAYIPFGSGPRRCLGGKLRWDSKNTL